MQRRRRGVCERYSERERERERESESEKERVKKSDLKLINVCTVAFTIAADAQVGIKQCTYCSVDGCIYTKKHWKSYLLITRVRIYAKTEGCAL